MPLAVEMLLYGSYTELLIAETRSDVPEHDITHYTRCPVL